MAQTPNQFIMPTTEELAMMREIINDPQHPAWPEIRKLAIEADRLDRKQKENRD